MYTCEAGVRNGDHMRILHERVRDPSLPMWFFDSADRPNSPRSISMASIWRQASERPYSPLRPRSPSSSPPPTRTPSPVLEGVFDQVPYLNHNRDVRQSPQRPVIHLLYDSPGCVICNNYPTVLYMRFKHLVVCGPCI